MPVVGAEAWGYALDKAVTQGRIASAVTIGWLASIAGAIITRDVQIAAVTTPVMVAVVAFYFGARSGNGGNGSDSRGNDRRERQEERWSHLD